MDKTKIEWCDSTWNPVTGCLHGCPYCYARSMVRRFGWDDYEQLNTELIDPVVDGNGKRIAYPTGFTPTLHRYRLSDYEKKAGRTIFVCSMADLFGEWVPDSWIEEVFAACERAPQHRYLFLTKNPDRYITLARKGKLPERDNMWFGSTTVDPDATIYCGKKYNTFVSVEPILCDFTGEIDVENMKVGFVQWVIIGAETGNRKGKVVPEKSWIDAITAACDELHIPVFMKDSLIPIVGEENMRREFPWEKE